MAFVEAASAAQILRDSPLPQLRAIDVVESDNEIVLRGLVSSYHHKQLVQETVLPIVGDRRLRNLVTVSRPT